MGLVTTWCDFVGRLDRSGIGLYVSRMPQRILLKIGLSLLAFVVVAVASIETSATARSDKWWWDNLSGPDSSQFRNLSQITKGNVSKLEVAWFYPYAVQNFN